jgi:integrase
MKAAIKVCIRTGARPGCEFAALTAQHIKDHGERMEWLFQAGEAKTKRLRVIRITDPEILAIVREQVAKHPKGPIFRNTRGDEWKRESLSLAFRKVKERCVKKGVEFDADTCMYSCRHTYAKRTLQGYWTGKQTNIETLARLMGNSPQVCRDHYLRWTDTYNEPLWESA